MITYDVKKLANLGFISIEYRPIVNSEIEPVLSTPMYGPISCLTADTHIRTFKGLGWAKISDLNCFGYLIRF